MPRSDAASAHVPGAAWGIIIDGQLAHTGVTGYRDVRSKAVVTPDTVFRIASMTKSNEYSNFGFAILGRIVANLADPSGPARTAA